MFVLINAVLKRCSNWISISRRLQVHSAHVRVLRRSIAFECTKQVFRLVSFGLLLETANFQWTFHHNVTSICLRQGFLSPSLNFSLLVCFMRIVQIDSNRPVAVRQSSPELPWRLSGRLPMFSGWDFALHFELLLSDHPLICRASAYPLLLPRTLWPVCPSPMPNHGFHVPTCMDYPDCLLTQWLQTSRSGGNLSLCYSDTAAVWKMHRFGWLHPNNGGKPLSLKEFCRICFRRQVTKCISEFAEC